MIDYNGAQAFFAPSSHVKAAVWSAFSQEARRSSVTAARRVLSRGLGRVLVDDEAAYAEGDRTRDEYAVYEQALWMLENGQIADARGSDPVPVLAGAADAAVADRKAAVYAPEALRWLGWTGAATIRG